MRIKSNWLGSGYEPFFLGYECHLSRELSICECSHIPNVFMCLKQSIYQYSRVHVASV